MFGTSWMLRNRHHRTSRNVSCSLLAGHQAFRCHRPDHHHLDATSNASAVRTKTTGKVRIMLHQEIDTMIEARYSRGFGAHVPEPVRDPYPPQNRYPEVPPASRFSDAPPSRYAEPPPPRYNEPAPSRYTDAPPSRYADRPPGRYDPPPSRYSDPPTQRYSNPPAPPVCCPTPPTLTFRLRRTASNRLGGYRSSWRRWDPPLRRRHLRRPTIPRQRAQTTSLLR